MSDEIYVVVIGFVIFLLCDLGLFELEHRKLEKQHKRHKEEISNLFDDLRCRLYSDIVNYFDK